MDEKKIYDMRGGQSSIARLSRFDTEAFLHMIFYRLLIFFSVIFGVVMLASLVYQSAVPLVKPMLVVEWVLFTLTFFEMAKSFSLIASRGLSFGHLNNEYITMMKLKYGKRGNPALSALPFLALGLWALGFVAMLLWWNI